MAGKKNLGNFHGKNGYWLQKLSGDLEKCSFSYDYKKSSHHVCVLKEVTITLPVEFFNGLIGLPDRSDDTIYALLTAGLAALLHKYTGSCDIIIGMPLYKQRFRDEKTHAVLPLRNFLDDRMPVLELFGHVEQTIREAVTHQKEPVRQPLQAPFDDSAQPNERLCNVLSAFENIHNKKLIPKDDFETLFLFKGRGDDICGKVMYDGFLYKEGTIKRIVSHYMSLLTQSLNQRTLKIADLDILSATEKHMLLEEFNRTDTPYPSRTTIHRRFEEQADKFPDHTAVIDNARILSYRELNIRALRLAVVLREKGVRTDNIVGLLTTRSLEMIIFQLGILKAGGAYLAVDRRLPLPRKQYILTDSCTNLLVVEKHLLPEDNTPFPFFEKEVVVADDESLYENPGQKTLSQQEIHNMDGSTHNMGGNNRHTDGESQHGSGVEQAPPITPDNLAYVIYTSGTTGKPKGVPVPHRGILSFANAFRKLFSIVETDRVVQFASASFDASVSEVYMALLNGAGLCMVGSAVIGDYNKFGCFMTKNHVTIVTLPPIYVHHLNPKHLEALRILITAGSTPNRSLVDTWRKRVVYANGYGPTETTICASMWKVSPHRQPETIFIGPPLDNIKLYILDKYLKPVPPGVVGELCISGFPVTRGYLNRVELTAEKFIDNPFQKKMRMYKTGDLARRHSDGNIEFLGRLDFQVKIRGFRIEPVEIEEALLQHELVEDIAVAALENSMNETYLCAYFTAAEKIYAPVLKKFLMEHLPYYMIPSHFLQVSHIPLNTSGKVDKKALPPPSKSACNIEYAPPKTTIEKKLTDMCAKILDIPTDTIGIDSNFFDMGGHSLKAAILIAGIHKNMNVKISISEIFNMPTVRELAAYISKAKKEIYTEIKPTSKKEYYPLSSAQKRLYFLFRMEPESTGYNIQLMDMHNGLLPVEVVRDKLQRLIDRHESLRTAFFTIDGEPVQQVHPPFPLIVEFHQSSEGRTGADRRGYNRDKTSERRISQQEHRVSTTDDQHDIPVDDIVKKFVRPFDLSRMPLLRAGLINVRQSRQVLMLDMHHIISDGISMGIIEREFRSLLKGDELPPLKIQYKDFSQWQNSKEERDAIHQQEKYWLEEFSGEIPVLNLPTDYSRPAQRTFDGFTLYFHQNIVRTKELIDLAHEVDATLYMLLLAAYNVLLAKLTGQEEVIVGTVTAGRKHSELFNVVGMFANTLALRNFPKNQLTFNDFLGKIRQKTIYAFENQDFPFEELVSKTAIRKDTSRNPLFDVSFGLENESEHGSQMMLPGKQKPYSFDIKEAKFDLTLIGTELNDGLQFSFEFNIQLHKEATIARYIRYFTRILDAVAENIDQKIAEIDIIPENEKELLLHTFNNTAAEQFLTTIHQLFEEQVEKQPDAPGLTYNPYMKDVHEALENTDAHTAPHTLNKLKHLCFIKNPHTFVYQNQHVLRLLPRDYRDKNFALVLTHKKNRLLICRSLLEFLDHFDGGTNLISIFNAVSSANRSFCLYTLEEDNIGTLRTAEEKIETGTDFENFYALVKRLYTSRLIDPANWIFGPTPPPNTPGKNAAPTPREAPGPTSPATNGEAILLLGDTPGAATTGLIYLASFLRRHGLEAYVRWYSMERTRASLKRKTLEMLQAAKPRIVAISMKWFPHIARVLELCRIVKQFSAEIKIVLGGNTAAYYRNDFIAYDCVDYVVIGDGELPLLHICKGKEEIPNCLYKKNGQVVNTGFSYVQSRDNCSDIFLSLLEDILLYPEELFLSPHVSIPL
ncbi:MAG: amino acid adenylation domain-containing protein, partial [bacterium]|nr:amino acid adenylation domain-containing protein [bacterium]